MKLFSVLIAIVLITGFVSESMLRADQNNGDCKIVANSQARRALACFKTHSEVDDKNHLISLFHREPDSISRVSHPAKDGFNNVVQRMGEVRKVLAEIPGQSTLVKKSEEIEAEFTILFVRLHRAWSQRESFGQLVGLESAPACQEIGSKAIEELSKSLRTKVNSARAEIRTLKERKIAQSMTQLLDSTQDVSSCILSFTKETLAWSLF